jgi:hypothetical protein
VIVCFVDIGGIVDHHCLEVIVRFVNIGGIVDHHYLETIVRFVDICGGIVDHYCLETIVRFVNICVKYQPSLPKLSFHNYTGISTPTIYMSMPVTYVDWCMDQRNTCYAK